MRLRVVNRNEGKSILVMILDAYQEYCSLGYPKDPAVYVISIHSSAQKNILAQIKSKSITKSGEDVSWGFQIKVDDRLNKNEVLFGPEQISILWDGK